MKQLSLIALLFLACHTFAQNPEQTILVSPEWVNKHLDDPDLVILQISYLRRGYERVHIPGARFLWPEWFLSNTPEASYNIPDKKQARVILQRLGISKNSRVIVCHDKYTLAVGARILLTLEQLGLYGKVSFLNGGLEAWKKAGLPVTNVVPIVKKGNFKPVYSNLIVDKNYVLQALYSDSAVVVDARRKQYYDGEPAGNPRNGHIAGALNIPYPEMVDSLDVFKPKEQLEPYFQSVAKNKREEIVLYCFVGQTASVVYIAGRSLGYHLRLYDNSLQEWSYLDELPMELTGK